MTKKLEIGWAELLSFGTDRKTGSYRIEFEIHHDPVDKTVEWENFFDSIPDNILLKLTLEYNG